MECRDITQNDRHKTSNLLKRIVTTVNTVTAFAAGRFGLAQYSSVRRWRPRLVVHNDLDELFEECVHTVGVVEPPTHRPHQPLATRLGKMCRREVPVYRREELSERCTYRQSREPVYHYCHLTLLRLRLRGPCTEQFDTTANDLDITPR